MISKNKKAALILGSETASNSAIKRDHLKPADDKKQELICKKCGLNADQMREISFRTKRLPSGIYRNSAHCKCGGIIAPSKPARGGK